MKTIISKIPYIRLNDIFDELMDENQRLKQCLKVLIEFKAIVDSISLKFNENFISIESQKFEDINKEVEEIFRSNELIDLLGNNQSNDQIKSEPQETQEVSPIKSLTNEPNIVKIEKCLNTKRNERISPTVERLVCDYIGCGRELKDRKSLSSHRLIHKSGQKKYVCDLKGCDYKTGRLRDYRTHINVHNGIRPFKCQICGNSYFSEKVLRDHHKIIHISEETIVCQINDCKKQFNNKTRYLVHQKNCHRPKKRIPCKQEGCQFRALTNHALRHHMEAIHLNPDYRPFRCEVQTCNLSFKSKGTLKQHLMSHKTERNFICQFEDCKKAFKTSTALKKHLNSFHSEKSMSCDWPGCEYSTKYQSCLNLHRLTHSTERNYPCNWPQCGKSFATQQNLTTHFRIHTCDKKYACPWPGCVYRCTDSGNIVKHRKQVHKM